MPSHRTQTDALEIEAAAKRRLADEYDAAQERGEVAKGRPKSVGDDNTFQATAADIGLSRTDIHEARQVRDAESADPGIVRRTLDERLESGQEPTKAALRAAVTSAIVHGSGYGQTQETRNASYRPDPARQANNRAVSLFREIADLLSQNSIADICSAFIDASEKRRAISAALAARDEINSFIEVANA